jgi:hypothetical protein
MHAFRYLVALISFTALFLVTSTNCASLSSPLEVRTQPKKEIETEGQVEVTISVPEFIKEFEKLNEHQQKTVLDFFKEHTKLLDFLGKMIFHIFHQTFVFLVVRLRHHIKIALNHHKVVDHHHRNGIVQSTITRNQKVLTRIAQSHHPNHQFASHGKKAFITSSRNMNIFEFRKLRDAWIIWIIST